MEKVRSITLTLQYGKGDWAGVSTATSWLSAATGECGGGKRSFLFCCCVVVGFFGCLCGICFLLYMFFCIFKEKLQNFCKRGKFSYSFLMVTY